MTATPAKKPKPSTRVAKKARRSRVQGRRGPLPMVLTGYQSSTGRWTARSPAGILLAAMRTGSSWEIAARIAHVSDQTVAKWNARGAEIAATLDKDDAEPPDDTPLETLAYLHFHREAQHARVAPVHTAIGVIDRASTGGNINAAEIMLKRHPAAREYRPAESHEHTGPEGGPIPVDVRAALRVSVEAMVERMAANALPTEALEAAAEDP